ncbi:hypothetical protein QE381_001567 [Microbacterium sp. SORGH_AS 888]|nr:hypothetical protein [Microbacterium sp. SORGH_AS_0888]
MAGATGVERRIEVDQREGGVGERAGDVEVVALVDADGPWAGGVAHGTRCSHASVANFDATSASASAYSSSVIRPGTAP